MTDTLPVIFFWDKLRPDQREYRQQSVELTPVENVRIQVDVPADPIYVVPGNDPKQMVLTLAGMKYVIDQFDTVFLLAKKEASANPDDDWEEEEPKAEKKVDDWESDTEFDTETETDKVPWNDDDGKDWS